jgi:hypothetical protein
MTTQEFKLKYPEYSHLEGDSLWNTMEDMAIQEAKESGNVWEARNDLGYTETIHKFKDDTGESGSVTMRTPKFWSNPSTGEIKSNEEINPKLESPKVNYAESANFYVFDLSGETKNIKYERILHD